MYVGSSIQDVAKRLKTHKEKLRRRDHANKYLENAFSKYGEDNFIFEQILVCEPADCLFYEDIVIKAYKSNLKEFGYNLRVVSASNHGMTFISKVNNPGNKYGRLTLIERHEKESNGKKWLCLCDCGNKITANVYAVRNGAIRSCGCLQKEVLTTNRKRIAGEKYNRLTLIEPRGQDKIGCNLWLCRCDCGGEVTASVTRIRRGDLKSCGCIRSDKIRSTCVFVNIDGNQIRLKEAELFLGIHRSSINQRSRKFNETYQQATDHFYKKMKGKNNT